MVGLFPVSGVSMNHIACSQHMKHLFSLLDVTDATGYHGKCVCVCLCVHSVAFDSLQPRGP